MAATMELSFILNPGENPSEVISSDTSQENTAEELRDSMAHGHEIQESSQYNDDFLQPITLSDLMQDIARPNMACPASHSYWREVEQLYFVHCDLRNIVAFYDEKCDTFWNENLPHGVGSFQEGSKCLKSKLILIDYFTSIFLS